MQNPKSNSVTSLTYLFHTIGHLGKEQEQWVQDKKLFSESKN